MLYISVCMACVLLFLLSTAASKREEMYAAGLDMHGMSQH